MRLFEEYEDVELNITSLIDVVFILLIFFMVSSTFTKEQALKIKLPKAKTSEAVKNKDSLDIIIDKSGKIIVDGKSLSKITDIRKYVSKTKTKSASISADRNTSHGVVVDVMDELRKSGIFKIAIKTRK